MLTQKMKNIFSLINAARFTQLAILVVIGVGLLTTPTAYALKNRASGGGLPTTPTKSCPPGTSLNAKGSCEDGAIKCTSGQCDLIAKYVQPTINLLAAVFGTVAVMSIIMGGIQFSTSEGDPQKASRAKMRITNTIIAILAFLFLYSFLQFLIPGGIFNRPTSG